MNQTNSIDWVQEFQISADLRTVPVLFLKYRGDMKQERLFSLKGQTVKTGNGKKGAVLTLNDKSN